MKWGVVLVSNPSFEVNQKKSGAMVWHMYCVSKYLLYEEARGSEFSFREHTLREKKVSVVHFFIFYG
jgi:hypothetical protein